MLGLAVECFPTPGQLREGHLSLRCPPVDKPFRSGSTQSNAPWITKSVLPTAHSHVQNRIKTLMARSYRLSSSCPATSSVVSTEPQNKKRTNLSHLLHHR